jgi:hypothetical protein
MQRTMFLPAATATVPMRGTTAYATTRDRLMPRDIRNWNPRDCLVAVIDDAEQAQQAALALREAGFAEADVRLAHAPEIVALDETRRGHGLLGRLVASIGSLGDEGLVAAEYMDEARRGHHLLIAYAPGATRMRRACALVARYRAHTVHYFGRWVIRGL